MTNLSASSYSPMFREELSARASARVSLGLLVPDYAGITFQNI